VIRLRSVQVSDEEAAELARRLRSYGDPIGYDVAERLERGLLMGTAIVGTSRPEAVVLLNVIETWVPRGLRDVQTELREYVAGLDAA
jgi:hypothetical protein